MNGRAGKHDGGGWGRSRGGRYRYVAGGRAGSEYNANRHRVGTENCVAGERDRGRARY